MNSPEVISIDDSSIVTGIRRVFPIKHLQVLLHCVQELVFHSRVAENIVSSNAGLSSVHELAPGNSLSSSADVDIVHDNTGAGSVNKQDGRQVTMVTKLTIWKNEQC